ncbi:MAG: alpha/beta hydrolase, partial [Candidatus Magasanikbacteria bacterium]|nr:alpha/beta hydrolase [Candidatus Magasanikbacteria bacterium]
NSGWRISESGSKPGIIKRLPWSHMEDRLRYDTIPNAGKLIMPVLLVVGENDDTTPLETLKILEKVLPGKKEIKIIKNAGHTIKEPEQLEELKNIFSTWIDKF